MRAKIILVIPAETTMKHSNVKGMNSLKNVQKESTGYEIPKNLEFFNLIQEQIKPAYTKEKAEQELLTKQQSL